MLAGLLASAHFAEAQEACPLPAGGTPVAPPDVTAQQVESGGGILRDFALGARDGYRQQVPPDAIAGQLLYHTCLIQQDGSPWRSGSTYLVTLTPDGRVFFHAKSMSLSGRLLKPEIYGGILRALGIDRAALAGPAAARAAIAGAEAGSGGAFDIPGVPGASGYASVYLSPGLRNPVVLLAGFDLDDSHVVSEDIDYGNPAVTAADVVDRATLKAFVTEAGNYLTRLLTSADRGAASKARIALRDPNGPWRHGPVYLYVLDTVSNVILLHGAFPDRFELRPLTPTVRDAVTGDLILPQVIEAAKSGPEGGFVEYYFDDPTDATDSADIPKTGYARQFSTQVQRPDGGAVPVRIIVGSGFYGRAPVADSANRKTVVESVLPQVMRAMTASTVDAISGRVRQAASGAPPATTASLGGATKISDILMANRTALENGTVELDRLLADSSFVLPLGAAGDGRGGGPLENLTFWGSGDWRSFSGGDSRSVGYDGTVTSGNLGLDTRFGANLLAGLSIAHARGKVDYTGSGALRGELAATLTSVNPYMGWQAPGGTSLWAAAGYGTGEVEIEDAEGTGSSDLAQQMIAAGLNVPVVTSDRMIEGGTVSLSLKAETAFTWAEVDGSDTLPGAELSVSRQRLAAEGSYTRKLASGGALTPSIELGLRNDGGDGETGTGIEAGGALRYEDAASGLAVEGRVRTLLGHSGDYEETGVSALVRIAPGAAGRGLALSVRPAWGETASGVQRLWQTGVAAGAAPDPRGRLDAEVGYGLAAFGGGFTGTPYAGLGYSDWERRYRLGWRLNRPEGAGAFAFSLEASRSESASDNAPVEHGIGFRFTSRW